MEKKSETQNINDVLTSGHLDMELSSSIGTPVKIEKPSTGAHDTEISSVFQKLANTEESGALAKSTLKANPGIEDEYPRPPLIGVSRMNMLWLYDKVRDGRKSGDYPPGECSVTE
jgi:hypothetical protein